MFDVVKDPNPESAEWHELTDRYAAALLAMQRGEPDARERVRETYKKLKHRSSHSDEE